MSEQRPTTKSPSGGRRGTQAAAGVAGAIACLGIGWAVGVRSAGAHATPVQAVTAPTTPVQPSYPTIPGEWGDEDGPGIQWGTVPGSGVTPAQPGTGVVPPTTGSGGSSVAGASVTTNALTTSPTTAGAVSTTPAITTTAARTTGGRP